MDLLTHVLQEAGVVRRMLDLRGLDRTRALRFPCDRSIGLHIVTQGPLWLHAPGLAAATELALGDIALMSRGCTHVLSTHADPGAVPVHSVVDVARFPEEHDRGALAATRVISGAYQLWNTPLHPMFAQLPSWFILRASDVVEHSPLALATGLIRAELESPQLGSQGVLHGLLDVIFTYVLREALHKHASSAGLGIVLRDPAVHAAVTLLHHDCAHAWTLEQLASRVGMSRTVLAERFREAVGDTPLNYLRNTRVQHAMRLLSETSNSMEQIAQSVGYSDAFSFSKVFKRVAGISPRDFRRRDAAERALPYRFGTG